MHLTKARFKKAKKEVSYRKFLKKSYAQVAVPLVARPPAKRGASAKPKRKRATISIEYTQQEKATVRKKAKIAGLSLNAFIKAVTLEEDYKPPLGADMRDELQETNRQLTGIATNINQMAKRLNSGLVDASQAREHLGQMKGPVFEILEMVRLVLNPRLEPMP